MYEVLYIQYSENFQGTLFFRASASCSKILKDTEYFNTVKNSGQTLFFWVSAELLKILNGKKYIQYSENFQGKLCFSGQAQFAQNPEQ